MTSLIERIQAALPERYTMEREIGRGGMSTVYLARERHPNRLVAIKVLHPELTVRIGRERFLREIDFVSNLTHPHIVPIYAAGEADGLLYFVMPYVEGETLADLLRQTKSLSPSTALRIAHHIALALAYAHNRNIVHRDIKPENILLLESFALVSDFGVARAIRAAGSETITQSGLTVGTPAYMSPEQAAGAADIDARSDIYGVGCLLYEMLTGRPPFGKGPADRVLARQISEEPRSAREVEPSIPLEVDAVLMPALAKDREKRFASAGEFAHALDQLRGRLSSGYDIRATGEGARRRFSLLVLLGVSAVVLLAVIALNMRSRAIAFPLVVLPAPYGDSLAVMPIENLTGRAELDGLADAITYGVIDRLHDVPGLKTPSYISVRRLGSLQLSPGQIADSLRVRLIVAAQLREVEGSVRLDAELIDGVRDVWLNSQTWRIDLAAGNGLEARLVRRLVELVTVGTGLDAEPRQAAAVEGPAYEAYRLGRTWWGRRTPEGIRRALFYYREAIGLDSTYARAYTGLSTSYSLALFYRYDVGVPEYEVAGRALAAANRAIELDPLYADGFAARGYVISRTYGPTDESAADYARALELSPSEGQGLVWSGAVLAQQGKADEALQAMRMGVELRPFEPAPHLALAYGAFGLGQFDLAVDEARHATNLEPQLVESRALEGRALLMSGRADECLSLSFGPHAAIHAACLYAAGATDSARRIVDSIANAVRSGLLGDTVYTDVLRADGLASFYAWIGDATRAFEWIEYAFERSPLGIERRILESEMFDKLRDVRAQASRLDQLTAGIWNRVRRPAVVR